MDKATQRLFQLNSSLSWRDYEMAMAQLPFLPNDDRKISEIIEKVQNGLYQEAMHLIQDYLNDSSNSLVEFKDKELDELRFTLRELEKIIEALSEQKSEQLFLLDEFNTKLSLATGNVIKQILKITTDIEQEKLRQKQEQIEFAKHSLKDEESRLAQFKDHRAKLEEKLEGLDEFSPAFNEIEEALDAINEQIRAQQKVVYEKREATQVDSLFEDTTDESCEEARQEYEQFEETYQEAQDDKVAKLSDEDAGLLKKLFRKAARLCHPDTAADNIKDQATEIMQQLNQAREQGDIEVIKSILVELENGTAFVLSSDQLTSKEQIQSKIEQLTSKLEELTHDIESINESETWKLIATLDSWNSYFEEQIEELTGYLNQLQNEFDELLNTNPLDELDLFRKDVSPPPQESSYSEKNKSSNVEDHYWDVEF